MAKNYALLIGINYIGTNNELKGCVDDIENMAKVLASNGYASRDIKMLSDAYEGAAAAPTRDNIIRALTEVVKKAKPGDKIFLHYSGHGANSLRRVNDYEAICPIKDGVIELIADFELKKIIDGLIPGAILMAALDCCHAGDMLNLEFNLNEAKLSHYDRALQLKAMAEAQAQAKASSTAGQPKAAEKVIHTVFTAPPVASKPTPTPMHGYLVMMSGCEIKQTSADAVIEQDGKPTAQGAFTACLLAMIEKLGFDHLMDICLSGSKVQMKQLDDLMLAWMKKHGFAQRPDFSYEGQLVAAHKAAVAFAQTPAAPAPAPASASAVAAAALTPSQGKLLFGFAQYLESLQTSSTQPLADTREAARNDDVLQFPVRKKLGVK